MNENERAAYIVSQAASAMVLAMGMMSDNLQRLRREESIAYSCEAFVELINEYGLDSNNVINLLRGIA